MIIDTHSQLVTKEAVEGIPERLMLGYREIFANLGVSGLEETIRDMDEAGVQRSVIVAIDAETTYGYRVSNEVVAAAAGRYPERLIGYASVDPHKGPAAADELRHAVMDLNLKGLKIVPNLLDMYADDRSLYPLYEVARDSGIPVLFHTGTLFYTGVKLKYGRPLPVDDVAVDFPGLTLIMAHFGFPWFHEAMAVAVRNRNVYFNISGWRPRYIPKDVITAINGNLKHKALFGSDYPLLSRKLIIEELHSLGLKSDTLRLLLEENPRRVVGA